MHEYSWPGWGDYRAREDRAERVWDATKLGLPVGAPLGGEVIGRQPFGAFVAIAGHPDAIGLAQVSLMPRGCRCLVLPRVGEYVAGVVHGHAENNHQVWIRLDSWADHPDVWPGLAEAAGTILDGTVDRFVPVGVFVRVHRCAVGLVPLSDLPPGAVFEAGQAVRVRVAEVDLARRQLALGFASA
ncbi:S1 RNA-binding domain-containing protein [Glycomyces paridis]|uniref:S1 RNA-binding domain-containing protein n=1 Tax=Glycomyces paridis TaxID=2126555 RepID=UPI0013053CC4|nr:S1 RNA-binding domain-containing protein [Glycomyces paridis]